MVDKVGAEDVSRMYPGTTFLKKVIAFYCALRYNVFKINLLWQIAKGEE